MLSAQLYTQDFYQNVVAPKLAPNGIFVTQSGPAGVLTCSEVFSPIHHTLRSVFPRVVPYMQHVPSYVDTWVRPLRPTPGRQRPPCRQRLCAENTTFADISCMQPVLHATCCLQILLGASQNDALLVAQALLRWQPVGLLVLHVPACMLAASA